MMGHDGHVLTDIAVVVVDGFEPFELGVLCEVFGTDRTDEGLPGYDFAVVAAEDEAARWAGLWKTLRERARGATSSRSRKAGRQRGRHRLGRRDCTRLRDLEVIGHVRNRP